MGSYSDVAMLYEHYQVAQTYQLPVPPPWIIEFNGIAELIIELAYVFLVHWTIEI